MLILSYLKIQPKGQGFYSFPDPGATAVNKNNLSLQNIISHGLWHGLFVWTYRQMPVSVTPSVIPSTFVNIIPSSFKLQKFLLLSCK